MDQKTEYNPQQPAQQPMSSQPIQQQQPQQQMQIQQHQQSVQHQPSHHVSIHAQPNSGLDPRSKEWQHGLFDCFGDMEACLIACFLPCMLHGRTMDRINDPSLQSHDPLNTECMVWGGIQCFTCFGWLYNMLKRTEIRERYGIQGSGGSDCCTSYCCLCCALVQQDREVALRAGHYAPVTQGYQGQKEGMQMPGTVYQPQQQHQQGLHQQQQQPQPQPHPEYQQNSHQQSPPPQQAFQTPPPQQQYQQYQQQPMQTGVQSTHEQQMPTYPHESQHGQKQ